MKSLCLMCAVLAAWSCSVAASWLDYNELQAHEGQVTGCSVFKRMQFSNQMKEVKCEPRDTLVKLIPQPGFTFYPNYARVKRCSGFCSKSLSCMPVDAKTMKVAVRMQGYRSKECYNVAVEEHTRCRCQCKLKGTHCNRYQQYSEDNCACECMNKQSCDTARQMVWSNKLCKCVCKKPDEVCSTGLEWIPSLCRCAKVMEMPYDEII